MCLFCCGCCLVIRKHFTEHPYSRSVELERQVELRCLAPEGVPPPDVTWMRNGVVVEPKKEGSNLIVSSEGHLLVVQARLADMGNYTCVAENVAGKRVSDTAVLTVLGKRFSKQTHSSSSFPISPIAFLLSRAIPFQSNLKCTVNLSPTRLSLSPPPPPKKKKKLY